MASLSNQELSNLRPPSAVGVGAPTAILIFLAWDSILYRAKSRGASWASKEEYRRLPLACIGGPLYVIAIFWLGWTSSREIHWAVPMMSGLLFGTGFVLIFMAMLNYLSDAYETLSASAQSAASFCRSSFGAALPIAAAPMFDRLGVSWACSLLAFLSLLLSLIPLLFIRFGPYIRAHSKFCQHLLQMKEEERRRRAEEDGLERTETRPGGDEEKG